ncbi:hypothetical protein G5I_02262 [Acromyrmex echinatior]|uniref:Uncharacterized protein n=1 Tax=Acromyrmex echinatior TaxID=103372 RepID=F4W9V4_ACREC|nr:hypothetical protein G5I_02262 [Acromyrmex echinatior]
MQQQQTVEQLAIPQHDPAKNPIFASTSMSLQEVNIFSIPEPILLQLQVFGSIQTVTGEHLYPWFPKLPTSQIGEYGGFYGPVTTDNHNLYEEIPCLGVLSEAVRQSISDTLPGPYASSLNTDELTMTENLLGYLSLGIRADEAKDIAFNAGIKADSFPCYPYNTVNFNDLVKEGSVIQTVMVHPVPPKIRGQQEKHGNLEVTSLMGEQFLFTAGIVFCAQLWKKGSTKTSAKSWSCAIPVNRTWITNRNERRNFLPLHYRQEVFRLTPEFGQNYRAQISLVLLQLEHSGNMYALQYYSDYAASALHENISRYNSAEKSLASPCLVQSQTIDSTLLKTLPIMDSPWGGRLGQSPEAPGHEDAVWWGKKLLLKNCDL